MTTHILTANTNVSALTLANGDTIDLAGFTLNFNVQPTATGIQVTTPGTNGTCVFPVACVIPTWDFFGGANTTAGMIGTLPANCEIGSITAGTVANSRGVGNNNGTIGTVNSGSVSGTIGVNINSGNIGIVNSNTGVGVQTNDGAIGIANAISNVCVNTNNATVGVANGGSVSGAFAVNSNNGTVGTANGGSAANCHGVNISNASVGAANGGSFSTAHGVSQNRGTCLRAFDNTGLGVNTSRGDYKLVIGPDFQSDIQDALGTITTIYSIGPLSGLASIPAGVTVIELSEGTATAGFTGIEGISRSLGT
jgi:hypothetical protein